MAPIASSSMIARHLRTSRGRGPSVDVATGVEDAGASAHCERFIGTARRECLDWMIPLNEQHLRSVLAEWISHYNGERPHSALGPSLPDDPRGQTTLTGHRSSKGCRERGDRSCVWRGRRSALHVVKPETVIGWHRRSVRLFWTWKSRHRTGRPRVPKDVRALIRELSTTNPLWGAPRIHGELQKLGIPVS